jgi:hypothetical protein
LVDLQRSQGPVRAELTQHDTRLPLEVEFLALTDAGQSPVNGEFELGLVGRFKVL